MKKTVLQRAVHHPHSIVLLCICNDLHNFLNGVSSSYSS
ncbi:unnamed protein product [Larinioides sclopetarius]|uniref:Uncharacterized protein n=1 Tax=Larinioides sclopetarius TaxID=280406 RepID=A0AAV1Z8D1_9ARAC